MKIQPFLYSASMLTPNRLKTHQAAHINKGKIKSEQAFASIDDNGHYQYELDDVSVPYQGVNLQPYAPYLTPLSGAKKMGIHFPLQNTDEIIMAYANGQSSTPFILMNISQPYIGGHTSSKYKEQSIVASNDDLSFRLNDTKQKELIQFTAKQNVCLFSNEAKAPRIHFASAQTLNIKATKKHFIYLQTKRTTHCKYSCIGSKK